jgi:O-antigen chain-terminating methyltransferase
VQPRVNDPADKKGEQLAAMIEEIRGRIRAQHPSGVVASGVPIPDLLALLHARDAAEAKVAAIGTVNPRRAGFVNSMAQSIKRLVSRALDWHVREQVEFNRAVMSCVQSTLDALGETNRAITIVASKLEEISRIDVLTQEVRDTRSHWNEWRLGWEQKLSENEIHFLRGVSELQAAFQHRVTLQEQEYKQLLLLQHAKFEGSLRQAGDDIQKQLWLDLDRIRAEYETIIHAEIRMLRQKAALAREANAPAPAANELMRVDWLKFGEKFRGAEEYVKERQRMYGRRFQGAVNVLDIGCGRGEMLEVLKEAGVGAYGIDLSDEAAAMCRAKGLAAEKADLFEYLDGLADRSLGGIVCSQVVEHLAPDRVPLLVRLAHSKMRPGALLAIETPNPECLAIFATHFYLDPTHTRPLPPPLLAFYLEETGFGRIEIERLYPAIDTMPSLASLPEDFRREFFGSLDYAIFGVRLAS